jgi:hypothetical protein
MASGCGTVSNPNREPAVLASLQVSDAIMGQSGLVRVVFSNPVLEDTTVMLASTPSGLITLPTSATVLADGLTVDVQYMGVAAGTAQITATSGSDTQIASLQVVDSLLIGQPNVSPMEVGAITTAGVLVNIHVAAPLTVMLASSQASVATVQSTVEIPQFANQAVAQVTAVGPGSSALTFSADGYQTTGEVTVVDQAQLTSLGIGSLPPSTTTFVYAQLSAVPRGSGSIILSSTNTAVATVPPSAPTGGNTFIPIEITTGATSGTATITATYNSFSLSSIAFVSSPTSSYFPDFCELFANNSNMEVGAAMLVNLFFCGAPLNNTTAQIGFSAGGIVTTPSTTVEIPANVGGVSFPIIGVANGTTNVQVTVDGQMQQFTVTVKAPAFSLTGCPFCPACGGCSDATLSISPNTSTFVYIASDTVLANDHTFTLASASPGIAQVSSATVTIGAGSSFTNFGIEGVAAGSASVTTKNGSTTLTSAVTVP